MNGTKVARRDTADVATSLLELIVKVLAPSGMRSVIELAFLGSQARPTPCSKRTFPCSTIGTFIRHEPTPLRRGMDIANTILPSLSRQLETATLQEKARTLKTGFSVRRNVP
jgi:hypothetical protein